LGWYWLRLYGDPKAWQFRRESPGSEPNFIRPTAPEFVGRRHSNRFFDDQESGLSSSVTEQPDKNNPEGEINMAAVAPPAPGYPIQTDFQGYGSPNVPQPVFNQVPPVPAPITTTKNADGSTKSANGLVPNSSVVFRNPS
jgi:hypothetical protein